MVGSESSEARTPTSGVGGSRGRWIVLFLVLVGSAVGPASVTAQEEAYATRTKAGRGLARGAVAGGALGGLSLGVLSAGLCDAADCGGSFVEGFLAGVVVGGLGGGLTGLVVGSGMAEDGPAVGGWDWTLRGGLGGPRDRDVSGFGPLVDAYGLRAITDRTRFGIALEYLGSSRREISYPIRTADGQTESRTEVRRMVLTGVRLVAARLLGTTARSGGYLTGRIGLHPSWERTTFSEPGRGLVSTNRSFVAAPGGGVGVGMLVPVGASWSLDVEGRGDVIIGIGSDGIVPLAQIAVGIRRTG